MFNLYKLEITLAIIKLLLKDYLNKMITYLILQSSKFPIIAISKLI